MAAERVKYHGQIYVRALTVADGLSNIENRSNKVLKDLDYLVLTAQKIKHDKAEHQFKAMRAFLRKVIREMDEQAPEEPEESFPRK